MSPVRARQKRVPYRDEPLSEIEKLATHVAEIQAQQHAANAHRSLLVGVVVATICIVMVIGSVLFNVDQWLTPILRLGFGGG